MRVFTGVYNKYLGTGRLVEREYGGLGVDWTLVGTDADNNDDYAGLDRFERIDEGEMPSVRAIPQLVENFHREVEHLPSAITEFSRTIGWDYQNAGSRIPKFPHSIEALVRIGEPAAPALWDLAKQGTMDQVEKHWFFALYALVKIGPPAIPTLTLALGDRDDIEYFRMQAAECLEVIAASHAYRWDPRAAHYVWHDNCPLAQAICVP